MFETLVEGFRTLLQSGIAVAQGGKRIDYWLAHGHVAAVLATIRSIGLEDRLGPPVDKRLRLLAAQIATG